MYRKGLIVIGLFIFAQIVFNNFNSFSSFEVFQERLEADSRSNIENSFYTDFNGKTLDWMFGRGLAGKYYADFLHQYRNLIETGYLQFILNGGILLLGLYLIICLRGFFFGFFKSNNTLSKAMAIYILVLIIFLVSGNTFEFSFKGIFLWICIAFCYSKQFRLQTDDDIKNILKKT